MSSLKMLMKQLTRRAKTAPRPPKLQTRRRAEAETLPSPSSRWIPQICERLQRSRRFCISPLVLTGRQRNCIIRRDF